MRRHWDDHSLVWIGGVENYENGWYWVHNEEGVESGPFDTDEEAYEWVSKFYD